jgi:hypothetical protein
MLHEYQPSKSIVLCILSLICILNGLFAKTKHNFQRIMGFRITRNCRCSMYTSPQKSIVLCIFNLKKIILTLYAIWQNKAQLPKIKYNGIEERWNCRCFMCTSPQKSIVFCMLSLICILNALFAKKAQLPKNNNLELRSQGTVDAPCIRALKKHCILYFTFFF